MVRRKTNKTTPQASPQAPLSAMDAKLAQNAREKIKRQASPTKREQDALRRVTGRNEELLRQRFYRSVPKGHYLALAGLKAYELTKLVRTGFPAPGKTIDLSAVLRWLHEQLDQLSDQKTQAAEKPAGKPLPAWKTRKEAAREKVNVAWTELRKAISETAKGTTPTAGGIPIEVVNKLIELGRAYIKLGVTTFSEWVAAMKADGAGREVEMDRAAFRWAWRKLSESMEIPSPVYDPTDMAEIGRLAQKLTRYVVDSGIEHREDVVDEVHAELQEIMPEITRRQTMDAMSGYGKFKELSKDELSVKVRAIKGELQQLAKLEDMAEGRAPSKTGIERRHPSDEERHLIQQVEEAKKKGGFVVTDPERQLKTALGTAKTAVRNRIADLEQEISTRKKIIKERTPLKTDTELESLRKRRDELKAEWNKVFPPKRPVRKLTDQQKLRLLGNTLDREIVKLKADLEAGRLGPKPKGKPLSSPEIEAKRATLDALRTQREEMRLASPEYQAELEAKNTARYKQSLDRRLADWQERLKEAKKGKLPEKSPEKTEIDEEILDKKYQIKQLKDETRRAEDKARRAQRTKVRKVLGWAGDSLNISRALLVSFDASAVLFQGGFVAFSHPLVSAKALKPMFRAIRKRGAFAVDEELKARPNFRLYDTAGLAHTITGGGSAQQEEYFLGPISQWFPGIAVSERMYTTFLNRIRCDLFDTMMETMSRDGATVDSAEAKIIANFVNVATGRAGLGPLEGVAKGLATAFFAPRLLLSRAEMALIPFALGTDYVLDKLPGNQTLFKGNARTRKAIARAYGRYLTGIGIFNGLLGLAALLLYDDDDPDKPRVGLDWRSADYMKWVIGNTRIDSLSGMSQVATLIGRTVTGEMVRPDGTVKPLRGPKKPFGGQSVTGNIAKTLLRNKFSPIFGVAAEYLDDQTFDYEPFTYKGAAVDLFRPLIFEDIYEVMKEQDVPKGTTLGLLAWFGLRLNTYTPKKPVRKGRKHLWSR